MNKYLKIWMRSGASFGIGMGVLYVFQQNSFLTGAMTGVVVGVIFGAAMAGITYFSDRGMAKKGIVNDSASVDQDLTLMISSPLESVIPIVEDAVLSLPKARIKFKNHNSVEAKTGFTWKSFGEDVSVSLEKKSSSTVAKINSKSSLKTTTVDYGKNLENVQTISIFLKKSFEDAVSEIK